MRPSTNSAQTLAEPIHAVCPICGANEPEWLHSSGDRWMGGPGTFRYARCSVCEHVFLGVRPAPENMAQYYPPHYIHRGIAPAAIRRAFRRRDLSPRVSLALRWTKSADGSQGRLLDVGCATGNYLVECREAGLDVAGVEPAQWAAEQAAARGLSIWPSALADATIPAGSFDAVTLWDVIEHLERPVEDLRTIAEAIRPGGHVVVGTPVENGWDARLWGERWAGWDTPRHLSVFSEAGLETLLNTNGFSVVWKGWVHESYLITALTLTHEARERLPGPLATLVRTLLHARPLRELMRPIFRILDHRFGGSALTIIARREIAA